MNKEHLWTDSAGRNRRPYRVASAATQPSGDEMFHDHIEPGFITNQERLEAHPGLRYYPPPGEEPYRVNAVHDSVIEVEEHPEWDVEGPSLEDIQRMIDAMAATERR